MKFRLYILFILISVFSSQIIFADPWIIPEERTYYSDNGEYYFVVNPANEENEKCIGQLYAIGEVVLLTGEDKIVGFLKWEVQLENEVSPYTALVSNDGNHIVTFDDWGRLGYGENVVAIYDSLGVLIKKFSLDDILSEEEINLILHTVSSIWWGGDHSIDNINNILILRVVKNNKMSGDEEVEYNDIWIDLETYVIVWRDGYRITND